MKRINDAFERVLIVGPDHRPDRPATLPGQLRHFGIEVERFPAANEVDQGGVQGARDGCPERVLEGLPDRPIGRTRRFQRSEARDAGRLASREAQAGRRAIATPGAWGLLATMTALVERALDEGWDSVLVLEDDVLLHKDTPVLFDRIMAEVPADWAILQLGAMQLHWEEDWITWHSYHLYRCHGSSIGAHAFALRAEVLPALLEHCRVRDLPFDIGALHAVKRRFGDRCFTMFPNLAIQDATDSEIGMSTMFFREARQVDNIYRWHLPDYGLAAIAAREGAGPGLPAPAIAAAGETRHGMLARMGDLARALLRRRRAAAAVDAGVPAAAPETRPATTGQQGGLPPLKARSNKQPKAHTVIALVVGLDRSGLLGVLDLVLAHSTKTDVEPILITDCDAFDLFRERGLIFEYLPAPAQRERLAPELDWDLYLLRRLALIRRKWQPTRIVSFGPVAGQLLAAWLDSPFEDDSIHQVAGRSSPSLELA